MAKLSLREVVQSQLDKTPIIDGQLIICTDTGSTYRDIGTKRIQISKDLEIVSSLPLAPLSDKIYYLRPDSLYVYSGDDWILLNPSKFTLEADKNAVNGKVNINLILNGTAQDKIKIAGGGVTTVTTGETGDITIDTPHPDELLAALTNEEIDAITGGMVDDSGNPLPTPQVVVDATLTVSGRAADAKAVGDALVKKASVEHNHDDRYYTEDEINVKLYTKAQVDNKIAAAIKVVKEEQKLLDHPVGSIYMSMNATEPSVLFGGTWERIKDRFVLAAGDSYETGATGGEAEHKLTLTELPDRTVVAVKNESGNSVDISNAG